VDCGLGASIGAFDFNTSRKHSLQFFDVADDADHATTVLQGVEDYKDLFE
jgi:hypothetical protein